MWPTMTNAPPRPRRRRSALAVPVALLATALTTLAPTTPLVPTPTPALAQVEDSASWTIIYYGVADNDLEAALVADVKEMTRAGFGGEVNLYGLIDRSPVDYSDPYGETIDGPLGELGDFSTAKAFRVIGGQLVEDLDLGEVDMADPETLGWFVAEVMRVSPSDHTALILSDHGAGAYAFGVDEGSGEATVMTAQDITRALLPATFASGRGLDIIAFDACLMANLEVTGWVSGVADLLVASEDLIPSTGFRYDDLSALTADPTMEPRELASLLVESFGEQYATSEFATTSLSVVDLDTTLTLSAAVSSLAEALIDTEYHIGFRAALADSTSQLALDDVYGFVDLGDLAQRLAQPGSPDEVRIAADAVWAALDRSVVESWGGLARSTATGLSIAVPTRPEVFDGLEYAVLGNTEWAEWLQSLFDQADAAPSTSSMWSSPQPDVELLDEQGIVISAALDQDVVESQGLVDTLGVYGEPTDQGGMEILLRYPAVTDSGAIGTVSSSWGYSLFGLTDGTTTVFPSTLLIPSESVITGSIDGSYVDDGTTAEAQLGFTLDTQGGGITDVQLWVYTDSGGWASIAPRAGSFFLPSLYQVSPDGSTITVESLDLLSFDDGVVIDEYGLRAGQPLAAGLTAIDGSGNAWTVFGITERP